MRFPGDARAAAGGVPSGPPRETEYRPRHPLDLRRVLLFQRRGYGDPTHIDAQPVIWRACRTPEGVATIAIREVAGGAVRGAAWGPGAEWAIAQLPALCGRDDDLEGFDASLHPLIAETHRRNPGLRLGRTDLVFDALAGAIIEQKVTGKQAFAAWRRIVRGFGERAPGPTPAPMYAPPSVDGWRHVPSWAWHRAGLEPPQARTLVAAAQRGTRIERATHAAATGDERDRVLTSLPGVGVWTAAETRIRAFGGSSWSWGGFLGALDAIDYEARPWVPDSGWPLSGADLARHLDGALERCGFGPLQPRLDEGKDAVTSIPLCWRESRRSSSA